MDRDQRSRNQKSRSGSFARPPQKRNTGSRVGLQKNGPPPRRAPRPAPPRRPSQTINPQKPGYRPGAPRQTRRVTQAQIIRRRNRRRIIGFLAVVAVLVTGVLLSVNVLFKVTGFRVENTDKTTPANTGIYTEQQIIDLLDVQEGDNLFSFSTADKSRFLQSQLPYLDEVQVAVQMPGTVVVKVRPATERFAAQYGGGWLVLSSQLKILRSSDEQPEGLIVLSTELPAGLNTTPGAFFTLDGGENATPESAALSGDTVLKMLLTGLEGEGLLDGVTQLDMTDSTELSFVYQGRVTVLLGTMNNAEYKLRLAASALLDEEGKGLSATDKGVLDVSYQRSDGEIYGYFEPAAPDPTPTPEPEPTEEPTT